MKIGRPFQLLFLLFVVLGVFYPTLFAGINSIDDWRMFQNLETLSASPLWRLFLPTSGFYYRPLLMSTFIIDYRLWGSEPSFYHLGNILLHAVNAVLVFSLCRQLLKERRQEVAETVAPLLAGLLFGLHPVVTESVAWISGRTDLLGTTFVLLGTMALVACAQTGNYRWLFAAICFSALAILSKEIMVFFLPVGGFLIWRLSIERSSGWRKRAVAFYLAPFLVAGAGYFLIRLSLHGVDSGSMRLLARYGYGPYDVVRVFFKAGGFYFKKLLQPLPLNFAIMQVSEIYTLVGLLLAGLLLWQLRKKNVGTTFFSAAVFLLFPGIFVALMNIAWTPLAERYIYSAAPFMVLGCLLWSLSLTSAKRGIGLICFAVILLPMTVATAQRNLIWQDNARLYADTKERSPEFTVIDNEEAVALIEQGRLKQAETILEKAKMKADPSPLLYVNSARIFMKRKQFDLARSELMQICPDKNTCDLEILKLLVQIDEYSKLKGMSVDREQQLDSYRILARRSPDPFFSYRYARELYSRGRIQEAEKFFSKVVQSANDQAYYKPAAVKYLQKIAAGEGS